MMKRVKRSQAMLSLREKAKIFFHEHIRVEDRHVLQVGWGYRSVD